jgi:ABC-type multidrug transport system fused ATPase/permease subunit
MSPIAMFQLKPTCSADTSLLDYMQTPALVVYFLVSQLIAALTSQQRIAPGFRKRILQEGILLSMILEAVDIVFYLCRVLRQNDSAAANCEVHLFSSTTININLQLYLFTTSSPFKLPLLGVFFLQTILESSRFWLNLAIGRYSVARQVLDMSKAATSATITLTWYFLARPIFQTSEPNNESQPLLSQLERQQEPAHWFGYLKAFAIFWPQLLYWKNRRVLLSVVFKLVHTLLLWIRPMLQLRIAAFLIDTALPDAVKYQRIPWKGLASFMISCDYMQILGVDALNRIATTYISTSASRRLSHKLFDHVMDLGMEFHSGKSSGEVVAAVQQGGSLDDLLESTFDLIVTAVRAVAAPWILGYYYDRYVVFAFVTTVQAIIWSSFIILPWASSKRRVKSEKSREALNFATEVFSRFSTVLEMGNIPYESNRYDALNGAASDAKIQWTVRNQYGSVSSQYFLICGHWIVLLIVTYRVVRGKATVGNFVALNAYWNTLTAPFQSITSLCQSISSKFIDAERALQIRQTRTTVTDVANPLSLQSAGEIRFENVSFGYKQDILTLRNVNLVAQAGKKIAIVGDSGAGKSTILQLILRHYDATEGTIKIGGNNIKELAQVSLRIHVGLVPQRTHILNESVLANVRYAKQNATDEDVQKACQAARLPLAILNDMAGENGARLSGGQAQRIAIARIILRNPSVVLLDEATAALDPETETLVQQALAEATKGKTTITVAHRLSTVRNADHIIVMVGGRIVEEGSHSSLLNKDGKYAQMWKLQVGVRSLR